MASTVTASILCDTRATLQSALPFSSTFSGNVNEKFERSMTTTEITKCYFDTFTVTSTPTSVDLTALTNAFNESVNFATVRHLIVRNKDAAITLTVGGGTNGLFSALPPLVGYTASSGTNGSCLSLTTNITVDGTHKILTLTAASGSIAVDVTILGV